MQEVETTHEPHEVCLWIIYWKVSWFLVHHRGISVYPTKATAIATMKRLTIVRKVKSFLGRVSYIRRFVPGLALVTSSLSKLLKEGLSSLRELSSRKPFRGSSKS